MIPLGTRPFDTTLLKIRDDGHSHKRPFWREPSYDTTPQSSSPGSGWEGWWTVDTPELTRLLKRSSVNGIEILFSSDGTGPNKFTLIHHNHPTEGGVQESCNSKERDGGRRNVPFGLVKLNLNTDLSRPHNVFEPIDEKESQEGSISTPTRPLEVRLLYQTPINHIFV